MESKKNKIKYSFFNSRVFRMRKIFYGRVIYDKKEIDSAINILKNENPTLIDEENVILTYEGFKINLWKY